MKCFTTAQLDGMVTDACRIEEDWRCVEGSEASDGILDLCCHIKALACEAEQLAKAEEFIREVAWRFSDFSSVNWSGPDVLAHVADYFGVTVKELLQQMEDAGK